MQGYALFLKLRRESYFRWAEFYAGNLKKGFASLSRYSNPHTTHCKLGSSRIVLRSSCDRVSRGNESIPSPRHRAKTAPEERSIWLTCCTSLVRRKLTGLCNGRLTSSLHNIIE